MNLLLVLTVLFLTSCKEKTQKMIFFGNINNVVNGRIELIQNVNEITGEFLNLDNDSKLKLKGTIIDNNLILNEFQKNDKISGIFEGIITEGIYKGHWLNRKKTIKKPFRFKQKITGTNNDDTINETTKRIDESNSDKKEIHLLENLLVYNSHKQLENKFEKKNVSIEIGYYPEGMGEYKYSILYKNSEREVEFYWENEVNLKELRGVRLSKKSKWKTKQGITFGTESSQLEKLNGKPFSYTIGCSECDSPQERVIDWENGKLSNTNIGIAIYPNASTETDYGNKPKYYSNHKYAKNTKAIELFLHKK